MKSSGSARAARRNTASSNVTAPAPAEAPAQARGRQAASPAGPATTKPARKTASKAAARPETKQASAATTKPAAPATSTRPTTSPKRAAAPKTNGRTREDKDQPLFEDIRYLGRLLGDVRARAGRRGGIPGGRDDPPARREIPPRGRPRGRADARPHAAQAHARADRQRGARLQLLLAPGQYRRGPPPQPPPPHPRAGRLDAAGRHGRLRAADAEGGRRRLGRGDSPLLRRGPDRAGADRPPDRGAAQEHPRRPARHRPPARRARPATDHARALAQRIAAARARDLAVADPHAARRAPDGRRRDRQRAVLLPRHLPRRAAGALRRHRGARWPSTA